MNDEDLVRLALAGDQDAYTQLYARLQPCMRWLTYRYMYRASPEAQQEAIHDLISRVFERLGKFSFKSKFTTWATATGKNMLLDRIRRKTVRGELLDLDGGIDVPEPRMSAGHSEAKHDLERILGRLRPSYRRALVGRYLEGQTQREYATANGITVGSAKVQLCLGMRRARAIAMEART